MLTVTVVGRLRLTRMDAMKTETVLYTAAAVLCSAWLLAPGKTQKAESPGKLMQNSRSQHIAIERQRASVVVDHKETSQFHPSRREGRLQWCLFFHW